MNLSIMKTNFYTLLGTFMFSLFSFSQLGNTENLFPSMPGYVKQNEYGLKRLAMNLSKANNSFDTPLQIDKYDVDLLNNETLDQIQYFTYSVGGELREIISVDASMTNDQRTTINWTAAGEISSMIFEDWNGWDWTFSHRNLSIYNSDNTLASSIYEVYNGGNWEFDYGFQLVYLGGTAKPYTVVGRNSDDGIAWEDQIMVHYTYSGNTPQSVEIVMYDVNYLQWQQQQRWEISDWGYETFYPDFLFNQRMGDRRITDIIIEKTNNVSMYPGAFIYYSDYDYNLGEYLFKASLSSVYNSNNDRTALNINEYNGMSYDSTSKYVMTYDDCFGYKSYLSVDFVSPGVWTINGGENWVGTKVPYASSCYVTEYNYYSNFTDLEPNGNRTKKWEITQASDLGTDELSSAAQFMLYPNPVKDEMTISTEGNHGTTTIEILGMDGNSILNSSLIGSSTSINLAFLSPGVYIVRVGSEEGYSNQKFVKE